MLCPLGVHVSLPRECVHYAPQSMKYRFVNGDGVSSSVSQLALFDAALGKLLCSLNNWDVPLLYYV